MRGEAEELVKEFEDDLLWIVSEFHDGVDISSECLLDGDRRAVSHSQPDDLRGRAAKNGQLGYVSIFRHEDESVSLRDEPKLWIVRSSQIQEACLRASGKDIRESSDKLVGDVVIEKQFHA